jgi:hypothetical protein
MLTVNQDLSVNQWCSNRSIEGFPGLYRLPKQFLPIVYSLSKIVKRFSGSLVRWRSRVFIIIKANFQFLELDVPPYSLKRVTMYLLMMRVKRMKSFVCINLSLDPYGYLCCSSLFIKLILASIDYRL